MFEFHLAFSNTPYRVRGKSIVHSENSQTYLASYCYNSIESMVVNRCIDKYKK